MNVLDFWRSFPLHFLWLQKHGFSGLPSWLKAGLEVCVAVKFTVYLEDYEGHLSSDFGVEV
jgi:hypothetical protein